VGVAEPDLLGVNATVIDGSAPRPGARWAVTLDKNPRLPGAPLLSNGRVVGVTLADRDTEPAAVPAVPLAALHALVSGPAAGGQPATDPKQAIFQITTMREVPVEE
jgi:hypothetical protein